MTDNRDYVREFNELGLQYDEDYILPLNLDNPARFIASMLLHLIKNPSREYENLIASIIRFLGTDKHAVLDGDLKVCRDYLPRKWTAGLLSHPIFRVIKVTPVTFDFENTKISKIIATASEWCDKKWLNLHKEHVEKYEAKMENAREELCNQLNQRPQS